LLHNTVVTTLVRYVSITRVLLRWEISVIVIKQKCMVSFAETAWKLPPPPLFTHRLV